MERKNSKKELKTVLSPELYDELKYIFRPAQLENIIYKPETVSETKWQCCCGSESELEVCPICGMDKNTVLSKVNAGYLSRHRKARIAKHRKAAQDKQALMAAQMLNKTNKPNKDKNKRTGTLIGVLVLVLALVACFFMLFGKGCQPDKDKGDSTDTINGTATTALNSPESTDSPDVTDDTASSDNEFSSVDPESSNTPDSSDAPDDTTVPPETTEPEPTAPAEPLKVPTTVTQDVVATIGEGKWAEGAIGNTSLGGLVYTDDEYDYLAKDGIVVLDKTGAQVSQLTQNKATCITGSGTFIFYIDEENTVHRIDIENKADRKFNIKAKTICAYGEELYYIPFEGEGLYSADFYGNTIKLFTLQNVYSLTNCANKLYFSTDTSLCVLTSNDSNVLSICPDGAKATSVLEIVDCIFYTTPNGELKFYNPKLSQIPGIEYPRFHVKFTYISAYENRVYVRTVNPYTGAVDWICTRWTPGTRMFAPVNFVTTAITTDALYITRAALYDGNLNRRAVS